MGSIESIRPKGAKLEFDEKQYEVIFTVGAIDEIQVELDVHINDLKSKLLIADRDYYKNLSFVVMTLINQQIKISNIKNKESEPLLDIEMFRLLISSLNVYQFEKAIESAYTLSFLKADETEAKDPNVLSEQTSI